MKKQKSYKPKIHKTKKKFNLNKRNARKMGYDANWSRYRFRFLHHNPKCYTCPSQSNVVDHRIPWKVNKEELFWNIMNYLPLCNSCHSIVTGKFDKQRDPDIEGKQKWIEAQRKFFKLEHKIKIVPFKGEDK